MVLPLASNASFGQMQGKASGFQIVVGGSIQTKKAFKVENHPADIQQRGGFVIQACSSSLFDTIP
jgi:hypothetical protein